MCTRSRRRLIDHMMILRPWCVHSALGLVLALAGRFAIAQNAPVSDPLAAPSPPDAGFAPTAPVVSQDGGDSKPGQKRKRSPATEAQPVDQIVINGKRSDNDQRRLSTAAKIVVGRDEIERFGDSTLDEVLKRLPGISIVGRARRGGSIVMRGLGHGYTQILINGERIPPGFAIDELVPDQVERIEIYRAPTAETGARAIAGTINIVLREALRTTSNDVRLQLGDESGRGQSNFSWIRNDVLGDHATYNFTLSAAQTDFRTQTTTQRLFTDIPSGTTQLDQDLATQQIDRRDNLHLTTRLQWEIAPGQQLTIQPFLTASQTATESFGTLQQFVGTTAAPYSTALTEGNAHSVLGRVQLQWTDKLADSSKLEVHASGGGFTSSTTSDLNELGPQATRVLDQQTSTDISDRSWTLTGKYSRELASGHTVVTGGELEGTHRTESENTIQNGVPILASFGSDVTASVLRAALYAQDEWQPVENWSANAGIRWESIQTSSMIGGQNLQNDSSVVTPIAHAVWRFDQPSRDQLRISITRSYRTPTLQNLIALPTVNTLYPVTQTNVASAPDRVGNPLLRPELATGLDVAIEHYDFNDGVLSLSVFDRDIHNLIRNVTSLETVSYSPVQRWVSEPVNFSNATTQGIEMDAKIGLDSLVAGAPAVRLSANLSLYHSRVEGVVGPNNRLDQQPNALGNLGADYKLPKLPWTVGGNVSWTPPFTIQSTNTQSTSYGLRREIDFYGLWAVGPKTKLRFSVTNALPVDYLTGSQTIQGNQLQDVINSGHTTTLFAVRLEQRL